MARQVLVIDTGHQAFDELDAADVPDLSGDYDAAGAAAAAQAAAESYADSIVTGLLDFKGATNASGNPNYPVALKGDAYVVSVAGKIGGASGIAVEVGDVYVASADNAGGTQAGVGASWFLLEHNVIGALLAANNLSDLANAGTARTNLGLGTAAVAATGDFDAAGAAAAAQSAAISAAATDATTKANAAQAAAIAASQPVDSDLTALAALTTTSFGRSFLELANAGAGRTLLSLGTAAQSAATDFQPIDSDLTALAALTTTSYGRSVLEAANAAALRTLAGLGTAATSNTGDFDAAGAAASAQSAAIAAAASDATTKANAAQAASQPVDSDLTAIAALATTSYGRAFLALADAAAARTALALGTAAVAATGDFDAAGAAAAAQAASQPLDSDLTAFAGLAIATDKLPYGTGSHTLGLADFTAAGRALVDDADAAAQRTTLGLGTAATQASGAFDAAGAAAAAQAASQPLDSDLTAVAAIAPSNDDVIQRKSGAWTNRTIAQLGADLGALVPLPTIPFSGCQVSRSTGQTISNNSETAIAGFDGETYDTDDYHSTVSSTGRITIPAGQDGYFQIRAQAEFASNSSGYRWVRLRKNGSVDLGFYTKTPASGSWYGQVSCIVALVATDYIEVMVQQNSGGNLDVEAGTAFFEIVRLVPAAGLSQAQVLARTLGA